MSKRKRTPERGAVVDAAAHGAPDQPAGGTLDVKCDGSAPGGYSETYVPPREPGDQD